MADKKDAMLHIRVSSKTLEDIREYAEKSGQTQSEFCLNAILAATGADLATTGMENVMVRLARLEEGLRFMKNHINNPTELERLVGNVGEKFDYSDTTAPTAAPAPTMVTPARITPHTPTTTRIA